MRSGSYPRLTTFLGLMVSLVITINGCKTSTVTVPHVVLEEDELFGDGDKPRRPTIVLVREKKDLGHLRDLTTKTVVSAFPSIKERKEFMVIITPGAHGSTGYQMKLEPIQWNAKTRTLHFPIRVLTPEETQASTDAAITYPFIAITLSNKYLPTSMTCAINNRNPLHKTWPNGYPEWFDMLK